MLKSRILFCGLVAAVMWCPLAAMADDSTMAQPEYPVHVGDFPQEMRTAYTAADGLPSDDVLDVAVAPDGMVYAATAQGLAVFHGGAWAALEPLQGKKVNSVAVLTLGDGYAVAAASANEIQILSKYGEAKGSIETNASGLSASGDTLYAYGADGVAAYTLSESGALTRSGAWFEGEQVRSVALYKDGHYATGTENGLIAGVQDSSMDTVYPTDEDSRWPIAPVLGADFDASGRLWVGSAYGVAVRDGESWTVFEGEDGLPYEDVNSVATAPNGAVWFGTGIGAIRYDGEDWYYRQGLRWLPNDEVRAIATDADNGAWIATAGGISHIYFKPMTLWDKAQYYEEMIDKYQRRTEYGYVLEVHVDKPGTTEGVQQGDSDNDGLWTSMYGAGECFAYAATKDPEAKRRAKQAFEALRFLQVAPEGSEHAPPSGFVARTVVPTTEPDPNLRDSYTMEGQKKEQEGDKLWRAYEPRFPKSADGKYYWKSDTSSDELDGHFFFYPLYYDLVADTEEEKARVREVMQKLADHLVEHNYCLVDHAGVTRWGDYSPESLNGEFVWFAERGLKSLSILAYLNAAYHVTGDEKFREHNKLLREKHHFDQNMLWPEYQRGVGSANQSDDEMFLMNYYNLIKYEPDAELKSWYISSFNNWWRLEEPEANPFFNFAFASLAMNEKVTSQWGTFDLSPWPPWLGDSIETLKRFPLDRYNWAHKNSHRDDLVFLTDHVADAFENRLNPERPQGYRVDGKVLPVDERHFNHWNHNPFQLDYGGSGNELATGAVYTLSYYMGLYHGFIEPEK